ncbi:CaiF/GrlA family transcriptional regulator [Klebsiella variicola]|uniref:CaiF/GrlA family transcriptional regulator n=1 Tax=Klebsiella variicola TaxID=244366 RepID=UPI0009BBE200|nr:CaiF/GrlA family transcriptional regulator [Klebsiella variicola]MEC6197818.1 CaiF/GrlA family transcriptional regulator [Klebsiella variicola]HCQ8411078.1 CaiF/GrlA family transcriptional regulator [Klebsiella variicola]
MEKKYYRRSRKPQPYRVPEEIKGTPYEDLPLYMIIARWALERGGMVTVRDVRLNFNISIRRASDLLEYLTEQGSKVVKAECFLLPLPAGSRFKRRIWRVISVDESGHC